MKGCRTHGVNYIADNPCDQRRNEIREDGAVVRLE